MLAAPEHGHTRCIDQIIVSFSSRKSRSSYPYRLAKPVFGPRPDHNLRVSRQLSRRPPPWTGSHLTCPCPSAGLRLSFSQRPLVSQRPHFSARGSIWFSYRRWPSSFLTLICLNK